MKTPHEVFGWCWCIADQEYLYLFLYWKNVYLDPLRGALVYARSIWFYLAGFVHKWHAYHWRRYSKLAMY